MEYGLFKSIIYKCVHVTGTTCAHAVALCTVTLVILINIYIYIYIYIYRHIYEDILKCSLY